MDVFDVRERPVEDYKAFTTSFVEIHDERLKQHVSDQLERGDQWPEPWLSLNPAYATAGSVGDLVGEGLLHAECERIFRVKHDIDDAGSGALCTSTSVFPIVKRKDEKAFGEFRTKGLVLEAYDRLGYEGMVSGDRG